MLLNQTQKINKANFNPDIIVAVSRGGLAPARILSDLLEVQNLAIIRVEFYLGINKTREQPIITQSLSAPVTAKKVLIVDDISDTGKSLKLVTEHILTQGAKEAKTATIYAKPESTFTPDYFEKQTSSWVIFPWDAKETIRKIFQKQNGKRALNKEISQVIKAGLPKPLAEKLLIDIQQEQNDVASL
jgi:hypoxanthine phosphoribosyltransferase